VLDDWHTAPVDAKLRAILGFLEKLTLAPGDIRQDDFMPLHTAGVSDVAIEDAIYICAFFNIIDRVADSLDFTVPSPEEFARRAGRFLEEGYL
jgi:alkylhydroperoxidase family enzyme